MELGNLIYWLLVAMGAVFTLAAVFAIRYISRNVDYARVYPEVADDSDPAYSKKTKNFPAKPDSTGSYTIYFKKESTAKIKEKYIFEEPQ